MKRIIALLLAIIMVMSLLTACSNNTPSESSSSDPASTAKNEAGEEQITISFMHQWNDEARLPYWEDLVNRYMEQNPNVKIEMQAVANEPYKEKLRVMLAGDDVPDLFFTWDGDYIARFAEAGVIMNLDEMLAADPEFKDSFNQGLLTTGQYNGSQYGFPIRTCVNFILYYTDKFEQYGLEEPETWDEFMEICDVLKENGEIPLMLGNLNGSPLTHWMAALNLMLVDPETLAADYYLETGDFSDPNYVKTLETLKEMYDSGTFLPGGASVDSNAAVEGWCAGNTVMIYDQCASFKTKFAPGASGDWGIFQLPPMEGAGDPEMMIGWIDQFAISSKCEHPEVVLDFLKFFYNEENQMKMTEEIGFVSTIDAVASNTEIAVPQLQEAMGIINECKGFSCPLDLEMNASVASVYMAGGQELLGGTKTPEEIMEAVHNEAQRVIQEDQ